MNINRVCAVCFSATGNTDCVVNTLAEKLAGELGVSLERFPFTKPGDREKEYYFTELDLVVVGSPTYAGKLPNKILPDFQSKLHGSGTMAAAVVTFGNRSYDNSLAELTETLKNEGFLPVAGGAFACRHAFTDELAFGRPAPEDRREIEDFAVRIAEKLKTAEGTLPPVEVPGDAAAPYYVPKGTDGEPAKFLKAKPQTDLSRCVHCGACARLCPMGAISAENEAEVPGTCIKCQSCVRKCTKHAKYFDDPAFLSHVAMLEQNFADPKKNETYL